MERLETKGIGAPAAPGALKVFGDRRVGEFSTQPLHGRPRAARQDPPDQEIPMPGQT